MDIASLLKMFGAHGSAAAVPLLATFMLFTPIDEYNRHVAENERGFILDLVGKAAGVPDGAYKETLCDQLEQAIGRLCEVAPSDSICEDRQIFRDEAGC